MELQQGTILCCVSCQSNGIELQSMKDIVKILILGRLRTTP